jgi:hypothetical protein
VCSSDLVVLNFIPGLGKLADFVGNLVEKFTDFVGITSEADRVLEKLSKTNAKANEIGTVLQKGYTLNGRLLRPAMVMVGQ